MICLNLRSACSFSGALEVTVLGSGLSTLLGTETNATNASDDTADDTEAEQNDHDDPDCNGLVGGTLKVLNVASRLPS